MTVLLKHVVSLISGESVEESDPVFDESLDDTNDGLFENDESFENDDPDALADPDALEAIGNMI